MSRKANHECSERERVTLCGGCSWDGNTELAKLVRKGVNRVVEGKWIGGTKLG